MTELNLSLGHRAWPDVGDAMTLLVPVGSTEQHGPHLPLDTDTRIAIAVAEAVASKDSTMAVAPAVAYGSSGEHAGFPGTLSIGSDVLKLVLIELVRSADHFDRVVLVNGHGGNVQAIRAAQRQLVDEGRTVEIWAPVVPDGDAHAGLTETSLMLAIAPELVGDPTDVVGNVRPLVELLPDLRKHGIKPVSTSGVLGDPRTATAEHGRTLLWALASSLHDQLNG